MFAIIVVIVVIAYAFIRLNGGGFYSSSKWVPYKEDEMTRRIQKEKKRYNDACVIYPAQYEEYQKQVYAYENDVKNQTYVVIQTIPLCMISAFVSCFRQSGEYHVVDEGPQRGRSENKLLVALMKEIPNHVHIDTTISGYYPDMMVSARGGAYLIDIEIDEPYEMATKKEIHYIGCDDEDRNKRLGDKNWIVVRFSERQIMKDCDTCVSIIQDLVSFFDRWDVSQLDRINEKCESIKDKCWTKEDARLMAINSFRNTY